MKNKIKNILTDKKLIIYAVITIIFFGILIRPEFATDTYASFTMGKRAFLQQFGSCGRFLLAGIGIILKIVNCNDMISYLLSFTLAIVCMTFSQYKLYNIIKDDIKNDIIKTLIPTATILNVFSIELFLFVEKGIMIFGILMTIFAVEYLIKGFKNNSKKNFAFAAIFMLLANFSYQGVVGLFVAISLVYILKYSRNIKEFVINNIITILVYGLPALLDLILVKMFFKGSRVSGQIILVNSLKKVCSSTIYMIKSTYNIIPKYMYLCFIGIIVLYTIYLIIKKEKSKKTIGIEIAKVMYIIIGVLFATIMPQLMQNTESIWFVARSTYTYASLFGILLLYMNTNFEIQEKMKNLIVLLSIILLLCQFYKFNIIEVDRYKLNEMDYQITQEIKEKISQYEKKTGNEITKIAIYSDKNISYTYDGIFATGDTNLKSYYSEWSVRAIVQYYTGKSLEIVECDSKKKQEFSEKNWCNFSIDDQVILEDNTMHICRY